MRKPVYWVSTSSHLWKDERVLYELTDAGKLVWMYLLTGHHVMGFPLAFSTTLESLISLSNITPRTFKRGMGEAVKAGMVKADWRRRVVVLPNALKHHTNVRGGALSSKVLKGWVGYASNLPTCSLKQEVWGHLLDAAKAGRPREQDTKEATCFNQVVDTIKELQDTPSVPYRSNTRYTREEERHTGAAAPVGRTGRRGRGRKDGPHKSSSSPSIHPSPTPSSANLEGEARAFVESTWNAVRTRLGLSTTRPEALTAAQAEQVRALVAQAQQQRPDAAGAVLERLCGRFHELPDKPEVLELGQLLRPKGWPWRLDKASLDIPRVEAAPAPEAIPETEAGHAWREVLQALERDGKHATIGQMRRLRPVLLEDAELVLECEDGNHAAWADDLYRAFLETTAWALGLGVERVRFMVREGLPGAEREEAAQ